MDENKAAQLSAAIQAIRERVAARHPVSADPANPSSSPVPLVDLMPVLHARDAAEAKVASIGTVNPRPPGLLNDLIQAIKQMIARSTNWLYRDQVEFNQAVMGSVQATLDALNDVNRLAVDLSARIDTVAARVDRCQDQANQLADIHSHWIEWRNEWEHRFATNEVQFMRGVAELDAAFQQRTAQQESFFRNHVSAQHREYEAALARSIQEIQQDQGRRLADLDRALREEFETVVHRHANEVRQEQSRLVDLESAFERRAEQQYTDFRAELTRASAEIQRRLWDDLRDARQEMERLIHHELRLVRQRLSAWTPAPSPAPPSPAAIAAEVPIDSNAFAARFRGSEDYVRACFAGYVERFQGCQNVLDAGCGRGEFLELLRDASIPAVGVDANPLAAALCRSKGLTVHPVDLFEYLADPGAPVFDGIFCGQVVEHFPPERLPVFVELLGSRMTSGGRLVIETPNPECLAIFATHFYLDPTHTRPVPAQLLAFYLEEAGFGEIEVQYTGPPIPEAEALPDSVRKKFFTGFDYAISARRL